MITGIVIGCYAGVWLFVARRALYAIRADGSMPVADGRIDRVMVGVVAMAIGLLWPLALPITLIMWHPRKTPSELREQLHARDERIAELEREAGIGQ